MDDYRKIRYTKLRFTLAFTEDTQLVRDKASAIRGGIGEMLLRANCIADRRCEQCGFYKECIVQRTMYSQFDACPPSVHPGDSVGYIVYCPETKQEFYEGDTLRFTLTLFGKTIVYFSQYLNAVYSLGQSGLGKNKSKYTVLSVANIYKKNILDGSNVYMERYRWETLGDYIDRRIRNGRFNPENIVIDFTTPLSLKYQGKFVRTLTAEAVKAGILRRLMILSRFENISCGYKEDYEPDDDFPELYDTGSYLMEVSRYSSRRSQSMLLKGITGRAILTGISRKWLELLIAGEVTNIGKDTSFGFGKYYLREYKGGARDVFC